MIWVIVLIVLIFVVCREANRPVGRRVRNADHRSSADLAPAGVVEQFLFFMGVLIREVSPILKVVLVEALKFLGWLCIEIGWGLLWLLLATEKVLGIGWHKFDTFCSDQIDPNWKIDQMATRAQAEIDFHKGKFHSYRQETIRRVEEQKELAEAKQIAMAWEIEKVKQFGQEQLELLAAQFTDLSAWAEGECHKQQLVASRCPHCGKKVLLARKAANKIVKCPYRQCHGRIKVTV